MVVADLLKLAQQLPFAAMVNRQNVLSYIPILSTLAGTLEFMRNMGPWVQAASPSLQLSQGGGAGAELGPASQQGVPPTLSPGAPVVHSGREGQRGPTETVLATLPGAPPAAIAVSAVGTAAAAGAAAAAGTPAVAWQLRGDAAGAGAAGAQTKESMLSTGQLAGRHFATQADTVPHTDMQKHKQLGAQVWTWAGTEWGTQEGRQGVMQAVTEWDTQGSRQGVTQASTQAQTQGGTKGGTQGGTQAGAQAGPIALSGRVRPKTVTPGSRTAQAARQAGGGQTTAGARVGVVGAGLAEAGAAGAGAAGARAAGAGAAAGQQATPLARAAVASSLESWQRGVDDVCGGDARAAGAAAAAFHLSGKRPHCDEGEGEGEVRLAKKAGQQGSGQGAAVDGGMQGAALEALGAEPAAQDRPAKRPELWQPADGEQDDARVALGLMTMEEVRWERAQARATAAAAGEAGTAT